MVTVEQDIEDAGAAILWVLEADRFRTPGTRELCDMLFDTEGSTRGICVGDAQTEPVPGTFDDAPFSRNRGFDILVDRRSMEIVWASSHGSTSGNENPTAEEVVAAVEDAVRNASAPE